MSRRGLQLVLAIGKTRLFVFALLVAVAASIGAAAGNGPAGTDVRDGGTFRIALAAGDSLDPALSYTRGGWALLDATCVRLMSYPDKPPPAGLRLVPEVAAAQPTFSRDRRTWTFTLRNDFRFSDGEPVRARAFARAIYRMLAPGVKSPGVQYAQDIVGAADVQAGKTTVPAGVGVTARGNRLVVRFTRAAPDFPARTTMPFFCAVPPGLPADPEGVRRGFPGAGPYFVAEYRPGEKAVLKRNRFYAGKRPQHVDRFVVDLQARSHDDVLDRIEGGDADWGWAPPAIFLNPQRRLAAKYGVNRAQFWVKPSLQLVSFSLNTSRPLFRNNPQLRRAVNFALDRPAFQASVGALGSSLTDQYLPPRMPGFTDAHIYPLNGPNLRKARSLARGHLRGGKAVLYTFDGPRALALGQIVKQDLAKIGIDVEVKGIPDGAFSSRLAAPGEHYDMAFNPWEADYKDPYAMLNLLLDGQFVGVGGANTSRFDSPKYNRLLRRAALLRGTARKRAFGTLDAQLARDASPLAAIDNPNELTLVSKRVGCVVLRPALDLAAVCLK